MHLSLRHLRVALIASLLVLLPGVAQGQEYLVEPVDGDGNVVFLNDVINGDTTATGARNAPDRIYVLQRDENYFVNEDLLNTGWTLRIKAESGSGNRPTVYMMQNAETGEFPGQVFNMQGHLWIDGLALVGYFEPQAGSVANIPSGLIRANASGYDLTINNTVLSNTRGQHIRTPEAVDDMKITNSLFANMGDLGLSNLGAGKAIDIRDTSLDTLLIQNTTFVNFQDRVVRHRGSTGPIEHFIFDHNTVVNGMSYHGLLALGQVGATAEVTNNLLVDAFALGADMDDETRQAEFDEHTETYADGSAKMIWIFSVPNETEWTVANNYYTVSDVGQTFFDAISDADFLGVGAILSDHILGKSGVEAFEEAEVALAEAPELMVAMMEWYRSPSGANKTKETGTFVREEHDFDRRPVTYFLEDFDASYGEESAAYTGAAGDCPAGDLNWFPTLMDDCLDAAVPIEDVNEGIVTEFRLGQNYPNPFRSTTTMRFALPEAARVSLTVYNALGQEVARLVDDRMFAAGTYDVRWDAREGVAALPSGVYLYQLRTGEHMLTKKMVLVK